MWHYVRDTSLNGLYLQNLNPENIIMSASNRVPKNVHDHTTVVLSYVPMYTLPHDILLLAYNNECSVKLKYMT